MAPLPRAFCFLPACVALVATLRAQSPLPPERVPLDSFTAFRSVPANWRLAGGLAGDPRVDKVLAVTPGTGLIVNTPIPDAREHLFTAWDHGDIEVDLDFLLPPGGDSGLYLQSRYEVQIRDSWGVREPKISDCGGISQTWDRTKEKGQEATAGSAPRANACRAPGLWQHLHVEFLAPRFDANGKKTRNARFAKVSLNGFVIQEDVEVPGPTRGAAAEDEKPRAPLMLQGNNPNGSVAFRALAVKRTTGETITAENLRYKLYAGDFKAIGAYDRDAPNSVGVPERFAQGAVEKTGKFALVFSGSLVVPRDGAYRFGLEGTGQSRLLIDDRAVVVPLERGSQPGSVELSAGTHTFRLDFVHNSNARPALELLAEGPGLPPRTLTVREREPRTASRPKPILIEPAGSVRVQRGFVPFDPRKRLYAISVGTPAGVHFAYDFETGAVLRVWRGAFLNTTEMWENRGEPQLARPNGPALTFNAKPAIAFIESALTGDWPDAPEALWSSQGYTLEADGTPVFLSTLDTITVRDRLAPTPDGGGLAREVQLKGKLNSWPAWMLLAEAPAITPQPVSRGWIVGDREWYLDWPADAAAPAVVRSINGHQQLAVPLTTVTLEKPIHYMIVW